MALPDLNQQPMSQIYKGFLHTSNTPIIKKDTLVKIYDGEGNPSAMKLGRENDTDAVEFSKSLIAEDFLIKRFKSLIDYLYPVGAIFLSFDERNPQERFIDTEWTRVSEGRFLVGIGTNGIGTNTDVNTNTVDYTSGNNIGVNRITLKIDNLPSHSHDSLNFVVVINNNNPYSVNLFYEDYRSEIDNLFINNNLISNYSLSKVLISKWGSPPTPTIVGVGESYPLTFSGVSLIANTGDGIAFDNKLTSYGIYVWKRSK